MIYQLKGLIDGAIVSLNGKQLFPSFSQRVYNHSPNGFNWGYGGSGPAQLALAILLELTSQDNALKDYQDFKWKIVANLLQGKDFEIKFNYEPKSKSVPYSSFDLVS